MDKSTVMKNYRFLALMLLATVAGCVAGWLFPEFGHLIKPTGTVFINMIFCVAVSLVFIPISNSVVSARSRKRIGKIVGTTVLTFVVTGAVAVVIMSTAIKLIPPALEPWTGMAVEAIGEHAFLADMVVDFFATDDFTGLLNRSAMPPLIVFSVLFGFAINLADGPGHVIGEFLDGLTEVMMVFVEIITYYAPIAFFALSTSLVATCDFSVAFAYGRAMVVYYPLCPTYIFTAFPLFAYIGDGRHGIKTMFQHIARPAVMSLGTCSSSTAVPTNLCKVEDTGIPKDVADMVMPIGATMRMDGSCFPCVLKTASVLGAMGVDMPQTVLPIVVAVAILSSAGMPGVPGGGYIGGYIIYSILFPQQIEVALPILVAIGNLVDPPAITIDSVGDYMVCYIVARVTDGKNWLDRAIAAGHAKQHPPGAPYGAGYLPEKQRGNET